MVRCIYTEPFRNGGMIVLFFDCLRNQLISCFLKYLIYCTNPSLDTVICDSSGISKVLRKLLIATCN